MPLKVKVFGRAGSDSMKAIREWLGNHQIAECHMAFNYGLQGEKLAAYEAKHPQIRHIPIFNHKQFGNKYESVKAAQEAGVPAPNSWHPKEFRADMEFEEGKYIVKPYYSLGGKGVKEWNGKPVSAKKYIQSRISNRRYELRCHAWAWVDPSEWIFQKRVHDVGDDVLAWNHHNGGKFITVENPEEPLFQRVREDMKKLMKKYGYQFGAGDFIIQNPGKRGEPLKHWFIEWNLAPGWTIDRTEKKYREFFKRLELLTKEDVDLLIEGIFPWKPEYERPADEFVDAPRADGPRVEVPDEEPLDIDDLAQPAFMDEVDELIKNKWIKKSMKELMITKEQMYVDDIARIIQEHAAYMEQRAQEHEELLAREEAIEEQAHVVLEAEQDDAARYAEIQQEIEMEMNFCPECGRPVNRDIFGGLPKFCTSCGRRVR